MLRTQKHTQVKDAAGAARATILGLLCFAIYVVPRTGPQLTDELELAFGATHFKESLPWILFCSTCFKKPEPLPREQATRPRRAIHSADSKCFRCLLYSGPYYAGCMHLSCKPGPHAEWPCWRRPYKTYSLLCNPSRASNENKAKLNGMCSKVNDHGCDPDRSRHAHQPHESAACIMHAR